VGRVIRSWTPDASPPPCCNNCQLVLQKVEDSAQTRFDADWKAKIGRQRDCAPPPFTPTHTPQTTAETTPRDSVFEPPPAAAAPSQHTD